MSDDLTIQEKKDLAELTNIIDGLLSFSEFKQSIGEDWDNPKYFDKVARFHKGENEKKKKIILHYLQNLYKDDRGELSIFERFQERIIRIISHAIQLRTINNVPISPDEYSRINEITKRVGVSLQNISFDPTSESSNRNSKYNKLFDEINLHPKIKQVSENLFKDGHYASAIFEAFKEVTNFVKEKSGEKSIDGTTLMAKIFNKDTPILKLNNLQEDWEKDEQAGFMYLYMGASLGIRNPKAHAYIVQKDPYKTLKFLSFASILIEKIDDQANVFKIS